MITLAEPASNGAVLIQTDDGRTMLLSAADVEKIMAHVRSSANLAADRHLEEHRSLCGMPAF